MPSSAPSSTGLSFMTRTRRPRTSSNVTSLPPSFASFSAFATNASSIFAAPSASLLQSQKKMYCALGSPSSSSTSAMTARPTLAGQVTVAGSIPAAVAASLMPSWKLDLIDLTSSANAGSFQSLPSAVGPMRSIMPRTSSAPTTTIALAGASSRIESASPAEARVAMNMAGVARSMVRVS